MGHEVFNPGDHPLGTRRQCMEADIAWICRKAEGMVMLFNWVRSSGASAELATAKALGIPVWYQEAMNPQRFIFMLRSIRFAVRDDLPSQSGLAEPWP